MAKYKEIQALVQMRAHFVPKTCWIAHILADRGLTTRTAWNRIDPERRANPCPPANRAEIKGAIRQLDGFEGSSGAG